jgi:hypothetical protein
MTTPHAPPRPPRSPWWIALVAVAISVPVTLLIVLALLDTGRGEPPPDAGPPAPVLPAQSVPAAFVGTWTGQATADNFPGVAVAARITITDRPVDGVVGSGTFTAAGMVCSATYTLIAQTGTSLKLQPGIPHQPSCPRSVSVRAQLDIGPDGTLHYTENSEYGRGTGVLRRG